MRLSFVLRWQIALFAILPGSVFAQISGITVGNVAHSNLQPSTGMNYIVRTDQTDFDNVGEIKLFGGDYAPGGWSFADGSLLSPTTHADLYNKIGTTYGGNGVSTFALPDLRNNLAMHQGFAPALTPRPLGTQTGALSSVLTNAQMPAHVHSLPNGNFTTIAGGNQPISIMQPSLAVNYTVVLQGFFPQQSGGTGFDGHFLGQVRMNASSFVPTTEARLDGQILPIALNQPLYSVIGTKYGGNGTTTLQLPDLRGRVPVGMGTGAGLSPRAVGESFGQEETTLTLNQLPVHEHLLPGGGLTGATGGSQPYSEMQPSLTLNYIIATSGVYPSKFADVGNSKTLGEIALFAGDFAPDGWALCNGQLLSIATNTPLFSVIGTNFGGDGRSTFALPDLQGRSAVGFGIDFELGALYGEETHVLQTYELPAHTHVAPEPASLAGLALTGLALLRRRTRSRIAA
jgi:microcystin-dependent protein